MRKIILASHGHFASGIMNSLELIYGKVENILVLECYINEDFDLHKEVNSIIEKNKNDELIVITDIFGGSVNNEFLKYLLKYDMYLVSGLNLPFLIELITQNNMPACKAIKKALICSKESIQFCNESIRVQLEEDEF